MKSLILACENIAMFLPDVSVHSVLFNDLSPSSLGVQPMHLTRAGIFLLHQRYYIPPSSFK